MPGGFYLEIWNTRTPAFGESERAECVQVARLLQEAAAVLTSGAPPRPLVDSNGVTVGSYGFKMGALNRIDPSKEVKVYELPRDDESIATPVERIVPLNKLHRDPVFKHVRRR